MSDPIRFNNPEVGTVTEGLRVESDFSPDGIHIRVDVPDATLYLRGQMAIEFVARTLEEQKADEIEERFRADPDRAQAWLLELFAKVLAR